MIVFKVGRLLRTRSHSGRVARWAVIATLTCVLFVTSRAEADCSQRSSVERTACLFSLQVDGVLKERSIGLLFERSFTLAEGFDTTGFGGYLSARFAGALERRQSYRMKRRKPELSLSEMQGLGGDDFDSTVLQLNPGAFLLTGNIELFADRHEVEVTVRLRSTDGPHLLFTGYILLVDVPERFSPITGVGGDPWERMPRYNPLGLTLWTNRGRDAIFYASGANGKPDSFHLQWSIAADGFVHCYAKDNAGRLQKLFPNEAHPVAGFRGGALFQIPKDLAPPQRGAPFTWQTDTPGRNVVRCFATREDPAKWLSEKLRANYSGKQIIDGLTGDDLMAEYRKTDSVSEAVVVVDVH